MILWFATMMQPGLHVLRHMFQSVGYDIAVLSLNEEKKLSQLKLLLAEAGDDTMIAGSYIFLVIAFFAAMAVPKAALLPLALAVGCYLLARRNEAS